MPSTFASSVPTDRRLRYREPWAAMFLSWHLMLDRDLSNPVIRKLHEQRLLQWAADIPAPPEPAWIAEAAEVITRLDPPDLNARASAGYWERYVDPPEASDVAWRHRGWAADRKRIYHALTGATDSTSRLVAYCRCGSDAWVVRAQDDPHRYAVRADHCHDRFCRPCMAARGRIVAANLRTRMGRHPHRLITLTVRGRSTSLRGTLDHLYRSFARLRRAETWTKHVLGGVVVCEVTWSARSGTWHPHLHIICEGTYIPKQVLSDAWMLATGDSYIVDLRLIRGVEDCVRYVTKYVSKPLSATYLHNPDLLQEAMVTLRGRRLCTTIGSWRGVPLYAVDDDTIWIPYGRLSDIRQRALDGHLDAIAVLASLRPGSMDVITEPELPSDGDP